MDGTDDEAGSEPDAVRYPQRGPMDRPDDKAGSESDAARNAQRGPEYRGCAVQHSGDWPRHRYLAATKDLSPGHVACLAPAHCLSVVEEWKRRTCAWCFSIGAGRLETRCAACDQAFYCNRACMDAHASSSRPGCVRHSDVCPALARFTSLKRVDKGMQAVMRLLLECVARLALEEGGLAPSQCTDGTDAATPPTGFMALQHHPPKFDSVKETKAWAKCCTLFRAAVEACPWCPWRGSPAAALSDSQLQQMVSRIDSNVFGVFSKGAEGKLYAHGVYLAAAMFNHSCLPNCVAGTDASEMEVSVLEPIPAGAELTIAYTDVNAPLGARQKALRQHYNFLCGCTRCAAEERAARSGAGGGGRPKIVYDDKRGGNDATCHLTKRERRERREQREQAREQRRAASSGAAREAPGSAWPAEAGAATSHAAHAHAAPVARRAVSLRLEPQRVTQPWFSDHVGAVRVGVRLWAV